METGTEDRRRARFAAIALGAAALIVWAASRMSWVSVVADDDKSGVHHEDIVGASWSTEITALALVLAAACIAGFALRRWGRRIVGILAAIVAAGCAWAPLTVLLEGASAERARSILTSSAAHSKLADPVALSEWAQITDITVHPAGPLIAILGCALALFGGVLLAIRPGGDAPRSTAYERKKLKEERIAEDLEDNPDSGRVLWDALDADLDPTDVEESPESTREQGEKRK
ncbi:TIGR02234 family membrane protein [Corynebacterium uropygiale]|uniref:TIGR02234 family membrane protein n=1 Tax=Corynebacterium uropygiale TaxID=1775911 RepID=A0A9X1QQ08_9CORY|nr:TIGR02234 family membrane protein [Corynebacterium uropygiale]